jgi:hypothetical protein
MDELKPSPQLLIKLGSLIVHYAEFISKDGHALDKNSIDSLLKDEEVNQWLKRMDENAFLPKRRTPFKY